MRSPDALPGSGRSAGALTALPDRTSGEVPDVGIGRPRRAAAVVAVVAAAVLGVLLGARSVPFVVYAPGVAVDTLGSVHGRQIVSVSGRPTYPTTGTMDLTTVSVTRADSRIGLAEAVASWADGRRELLPRGLVYPRERTAQQEQAAGRQEMQGSQEAAVLAAARQVGVPVTTTTQVQRVLAGGPSAGRLQVGDRIVDVDGRAVTGSAGIADAVRARPPGSMVTVGVRAAADSAGTGPVREVPVVVGTPPAGSAVPAGSGYVGIDLAESERATGLQADIQLGQAIGGPSAGTMFALAIVDRLTPGTLAGSVHVAGTGTIAADGTVGPIGGIREKMLGARSAGATLFLAPAANCAEAAAAPVDGLQLVRVTDLAGAVRDLRSAAAGQLSGLPSCATG